MKTKNRPHGGFSQTAFDQLCNKRQKNIMIEFGSVIDSCTGMRCIEPLTMIYAVAPLYDEGDKQDCVKRFKDQFPDYDDKGSIQRLGHYDVGGARTYDELKEFGKNLVAPKETVENRPAP